MNDNQLQQLLQAINTLQDLGKVAYFNKGVYNSETTYEINDVVTYQGSSYVSLENNNQGNLPTNATYWSIVASKGEKGDTGKPFVIEKTYISIEAMVADYDNMEVNDYVMISGSIEEEQNATLWAKTETPAPTYKWVYLADFSGASGITGQTPNIQIGNVTEGNEPAVTRRQGSTNENPILDFVLKTGAKGDTGATGNGISQVSKTSTSGLTDTYTIGYTNGNSTTFNVTNGKGITSIAKTGTSGLVDTYTITYNDGTTSTFTITNGEDGEVTQAQLDETNEQVAKANMVYNALPKVTGTGVDFTLNNTANCPINMEFKGNTEQDSYTGKNLYGGFNYSVTNNDIAYTYNTDGTITANGTSSGTALSLASSVARTNGWLANLEAGTYTLSGGTSNIQLEVVNSEGTMIAQTTTTSFAKTFTLNESKDVFVRALIENNITVNNTKVYPQLESGSTGTDWEPYVGGIPSPNPDYPQTVKVVTGNNTINITGKNLFDGVVEEGLYSTTTGAKQAGTDLRSANYVPIKSNSTIKFSINGVGKAINILEYKSDYTFIKHTNVPANNTITLTNETKYITLYRGAGDGGEKWQIEYGSTITAYQPFQNQTYSINLGTIELCKIETYQDYIGKSTGKNLFDKDSVSIGYINADGSLYTSDTGYSTSDYIPIQPNTAYYKTFTGSPRTKYFDENKQPLNTTTYQDISIGGNAGTFTTPENAKYLRFSYLSSGQSAIDKNKIMINLGSTATSWEPYGVGKWYKHSEIGKYVYNNDLATNGIDNDKINFVTPVLNIEENLATLSNIAFCNMLQSHQVNETGLSGTNPQKRIRVNTKGYGTTYDEVKTIFANNNLTIYYGLETPTNTEITDTTLIGQLNTIKNAISYDNQTNIIQENYLEPFIINAECVRSLKDIFELI